MKVALVYDRVNKWGGAERVLLALHKIWPEAPLYTAVYDKKRAAWAQVFDVRPSFLQRIPYIRRAHEFFAFLTPLAFESFSFDDFDVVISVTSAEAKTIITKPGCVHICYCLTPTRYLWSSHDQYRRQPGFGILNPVASWVFRLLTPTLRAWDLIASSRPDCYVAISQRVKTRIETYYHRKVESVIYPPVDIKQFTIRSSQIEAKRKHEYFLIVSRLVSYKRIDIVIAAFNELGFPLVIIGEGRQKQNLKNMAKKNIRFVDHYLTDSDLLRYYEGCRAFVFAGDEDFGLSALEAQAMGIPVIAYRESGIAEIVQEGATGILFNHQTPKDLVRAVRLFMTKKFSRTACRMQADRMSEARFIERMHEMVKTVTNNIL